LNHLGSRIWILLRIDTRLGKTRRVSVRTRVRRIRRGLDSSYLRIHRLSRQAGILHGLLLAWVLLRLAWVRDGLAWVLLRLTWVLLRLTWVLLRLAWVHNWLTWVLLRLPRIRNGLARILLHLTVVRIDYGLPRNRYALGRNESRRISLPRLYRHSRRVRLPGLDLHPVGILTIRLRVRLPVLLVLRIVRIGRNVSVAARSG
jgi:hypothetical protein